MSRKLVTLDRLAGVLLALVLVAAGLLLVDWKTATVLDPSPVVHLTALRTATAASWWPIATAAVAVILALTALRWLVAHLPHLTSPDTRLSDSSADGRIRLDTASVARAGAATLASDMVLPETHGRVREWRGRPFVQLDARCSPRADVAEVRERAESVGRELGLAFPSGDLSVRVVVDAPRARVRPRRTLARVQEAGSG